MKTLILIMLLAPVAYGELSDSWNEYYQQQEHKQQVEKQERHQQEMLRLQREQTQYQRESLELQKKSRRDPNNIFDSDLFH